ncbi:Carboxylesterase type B domain-containing protein OS=Streptomyces aurantiogriseus OX=66870 GN=GCM10010251_82770 PE=4 SV=1 [Streptomyces aurantiogriseus]|uniref:Carboxylesterase type B domain-containing protein n=1 Tax=Streptomyces aurantiogriseus TaxID=66870 RepID=A0A918FM47_9ACTN|nr:hypothetical protein GCM10010251_82770 [Streptomyces aurantiogriseus]
MTHRNAPPLTLETETETETETERLDRLEDVRLGRQFTNCRKFRRTYCSRLRGRAATALTAVGVLCLGLLSPAAVDALRAGPADPETTARPASLVVQTDKGRVRGTARTGYDEWLGIPYAADASGANRWKPPQPVARWSGIRDATTFGDRCAQNTGWDPGYERTITRTAPATTASWTSRPPCAGCTPTSPASAATRGT